VNSARAKYVLAGVASLLLCAAFFFFFVKSRQGELADVREQVDAAKSETVSLQADLDRLEGLKANASKYEARLAEIREAVPQHDQVANFVFQVQDAADRSGIDFVEITPELPKTPPEGAAVAEVRTVIGAEGGYYALQDFLRRLYDLDRALRVDSFTMNADEDQDTDALVVTLQATSRIFFELPAGTATTTTPEGSSSSSTTETSTAPTDAS
jgi:Tfp pilus assembly protein PilO